jgi:hypothetical protein
MAYLRSTLKRLAHRIRDFQNLPFIIGTNTHIETVYRLYWEAFEKFRLFPVIKSLDENEKFCNLVRRLLEDHLVAIPQLAWGMAECSMFLSPQEADRFMTENLKSRIGRRVLAEQHLALTESWEAHQDDHDLGRFIGIIDTALKSAKTVQKCARKATEFVQQSSKFSFGRELTLDELPQVKINGRLDSQFLYIPDHIEYILFELIKNSIQATLWQQHRKSNLGNQSNTKDSLPSIGVTIGHWKNSIMFRVSDQGGGIHPSIKDSIFSFSVNAQRNLQHFQTAPRLAAKMGEDSRAPFPLGISLAMSKVYANYWGGDIEMTTLDGFGTDCYVSLSAGNQLENVQPHSFDSP